MEHDSSAGKKIGVFPSVLPTQNPESEVQWFHRVRNEDVHVLRRASITKRLRWFGHASRMPELRLPNYLL